MWTASKEVARRLTRVAGILAGFEVFVPKVAAKLDDGPSGHHHLTLADLYERLKTARDRMARADRFHASAQIRLACRRDRCTVAHQALRDTLVNLRRALEAAYGRKDGARYLGLKGKTPRNLEALLQQGRLSAGLLIEPVTAVPASPYTGLILDFKQLGRGLRRKVRALDKAYKRLRLAKQGLIGAGIRRCDRIDELDAVRRHVVGTAEGLFELAGEHEMAKRLDKKPPKRQSEPKAEPVATAEPARTEPLTVEPATAETETAETPVSTEPATIETPSAEQPMITASPPQEVAAPIPRRGRRPRSTRTFRLLSSRRPRGGHYGHPPARVEKAPDKEGQVVRFLKRFRGALALM